MARTCCWRPRARTAASGASSRCPPTRCTVRAAWAATRAATRPPRWSRPTHTPRPRPALVRTLRACRPGRLDIRLAGAAQAIGRQVPRSWLYRRQRSVLKQHSCSNALTASSDLAALQTRDLDASMVALLARSLRVGALKTGSARADCCTLRCGRQEADHICAGARTHLPRQDHAADGHSFPRMQR